MKLQFLAIPFRQALQRYYTLYDYSVNMEGRIYDILMYLQEHCEDGNAKHRHYLFQCWRWCVAAQVTESARACSYFSS